MARTNRRYDDDFPFVSRVFAAVAAVLAGREPDDDGRIADLARLVLAEVPPTEEDVARVWPYRPRDERPLPPRLARDLAVALRAVHAHREPAEPTPGRITVRQVVPLLLAACPGFLPAWAAEAPSDADGERRRTYMDAACFVRHLVELHRRGDGAALLAAFEVIERLVVEGDDEVVTLGVVGYLEGLQTATVPEDVDPVTAFKPFARSVSRRWWTRVDRFWAGEHDALRVDEP